MNQNMFAGLTQQRFLSQRPFLVSMLLKILVLIFENFGFDPN